MIAFYCALDYAYDLINSSFRPVCSSLISVFKLSIFGRFLTSAHFFFTQSHHASISFIKCCLCFIESLQSTFFHRQ